MRMRMRMRGARDSVYSASLAVYVLAVCTACKQLRLRALIRAYNLMHAFSDLGAHAVAPATKGMPDFVHA